MKPYHYSADTVVREATTAADFQAVADFYQSFANWLRQTYPEILPLFGSFFVTLTEEAATLPGKYAPPSGRLLIAMHKGQPAGSVGLDDTGDGICTMRRMFVDPSFRGAKIGKALAEALVTEAKEIGYKKMVLATGPRHYAAIGLYKSLGFKVVGRRVSPEMSLDVPDDLKGGVVLMELELG